MCRRPCKNASGRRTVGDVGLANDCTLQHRGGKVCALFERLLLLRDNIGLLAEEYDPKAQRKLCNIHMHSLMLCSSDLSGADDAGYSANPASRSLGAEGQC